MKRYEYGIINSLKVWKESVTSGYKVEGINSNRIKVLLVMFQTNFTNKNAEDLEAEL